MSANQTHRMSGTNRLGSEESTPTDTVTYSPSKAELDPDRHERRRRLVKRLLALSVPLLILVSWEVTAAYGLIDSRFYGRPSAVWDQAVITIGDGTLFSHTFITVRRLLIGYTVGSVSGIVVGLVLSQFEWLRATFEPTLRALYVIPKLAILPILLLLFGLGEMPLLAFISLGTFYILAFMTLSAASMIPVAFHETAQSYGLTKFQAFRWLVVPASSPHIVAALRLASGVAVLLVVAVEFIQGGEGLGHMIWNSWQLFRADRMYLGIVVVSVLGGSFGAFIGWLGRRLVSWSEEEFGTSV